ncbi:MAG: GNAT family N-acetyltransferase [Methanobacteriota archaeon]
MKSMRVVKYSNRVFERVVPLLKKGTKEWGKEWRDEILRVYSRQDGEAYLAEDDGNVVGTIFLKKDVRVLVIYFLAVAEKERMTGVGSSLVEFAEKIARRERRILRVDVAKEFEKNVDFYAKLGFEKCGRVKNFYMDGDEQIFLYKKPRR